VLHPLVVLVAWEHAYPTRLHGDHLSVVAAAGVKQRHLAQHGAGHVQRHPDAPLQLAMEDDAHAVAHVQRPTSRQPPDLHQAEQKVQLVVRQSAEESAVGDG